MEAILKFELPEDSDGLKLALRGLDYFCALWDIRQEIINYNQNDAPAKETLDRIESILYDTELNDIS